MNFKPMPIFKKTVVGSQFEVIQVYDFQTKPNSYQEIYWVLVSSYVSLCVSNKSGFLWRHLLSLSLDLPKCMSFKQKRILMKTFVRSQFEVMLIYEFQKKENSYQDISWVSVSSYASLWVSNKREFLRTHFLGLSLKLRKFISFKPKRILMKTFVESQFEVM